MIYLDNNATTRPHPEVLRNLASCMDAYANPSSLHIQGRQARGVVEEVRERVASLLGANVGEIIFTSGGAESISTVFCQEWKTLIISAVEHAAVICSANACKNKGAVVHTVGVEPDGSLDEGELTTCLRKITPRERGRTLVSLMLANNETGVIFPLERLSHSVKSHGALLHIDAVQCIGKIPVDVQQLRCDYLTISGHKFHGIKGVGALYRRREAPLAPLICGHQEQRLRGGTENTVGIVAMGTAALAASQTIEKGSKTKQLRDQLEEELAKQVAGIRINGAGATRLPNTSSITFPKRDSAALVEALSQRGLVVSSGAACSIGDAPSHVLMAMGLEADEANASIRFSLSTFTTAKEIREAIQIVADTVAGLPEVQSVC